MIFFDTIYYLCCIFYRKREMDSFKGSGLILMTGTIIMNIILLTISGQLKFIQEWYDNIIHRNKDYLFFATGVVLIVLIIPFYYRFFKITSFEIIENKLKKMASGKRDFVLGIALIYILFSYLFTLGLCIYEGGKKSMLW